MFGWNFPSNNYGQITGLNDAGIETFKGNPLESLAREINQNSCDAKLPDSSKPVEVHFDFYNLPIDKFPAKDNFVKILSACREYWKGNAKTESFFDSALEMMDLPEISVLKISDFNTTGLTGAEQEHRGHWHNLIKAVGVSDKSAASGGAFGIGKHAPFACSQLRTVFYGTKDAEGTQAFQGAAKLVTHQSENGETTQGTGYYGAVERNQPVLDFSNVDPFFHRSEVGTDIFIMGFNDKSSWEEKIIISVLENFFISIMEGRLIVKVGTTLIHTNSLPELLHKYTKGNPNYLSATYYDAVTLSNRYHFFEEDFQGLGRVDLFVLTGKDFPKRIAMVRETGMKIFDKGNFRIPMKFAGVMIARGSRMNEFLRLLEPPSHNAWEPERHENPEFARSVIKKLHAWINERVRSISNVDDVEEIDAAGMGQYLPDELDEDAVSSANEGMEGEKGEPRPGEVEVETINRPTVFISAAASIETAAASESPGKASEAEGESEDDSSQEGDSADGEDEPDRESSLDKENRPSQGEKDKPNTAGNPPQQAGGSPLPLLKNLRVFCIDPEAGCYQLSFQPDSEGTGFLGIKIVGEVGEEPAPIQWASFKDSGKQIDVKANGKIGPVPFQADVRHTIVVALSDPLRCALEVSIHAD